MKEYRHERLEHSRKYTKNNPEKRRVWRKNSYNRKKENPDEKFIQRRLKENIARRFRYALKGIQKSERTFEIIGCSPEELKSHIEKTFTEKMSWENYGEWHVDHIIPCVAFDHTIEAEKRACWNFRNLRALWGSENLKKSSSFDKSDKDEYMRSFA